MLTHLSISNYTIVAQLQLELGVGMTAITGETGAGKSIMLDALGLCLGDRADPKAIRPGSDQADLTACFDLRALPQVQAWLRERDLLQGEECILRRVLSADRSRAYINGAPATLAQCAELGEHLVDIHSQHAHQSLLRKAVQRQLLDSFAAAEAQAQQVAALAQQWQEVTDTLNALRAATDEADARRQLLHYQVAELDKLTLADAELEQLEAEQRVLENAGDITESTAQAIAACEAAEEAARQALRLITADIHRGKRVDNARDMLQSAAIQSVEAGADLQAYLDSVELDPQRLQDVQQRLEEIYDIARKHRIQPERVPALHEELRAELATLAGGEERIDDLAQQQATLLATYAEAAGALSKARTRAAKKLQRDVSKLLDTLAMGQCTFQVTLTARDLHLPHTHGAEDVEFLISTNPGAPVQPLARIASGGELSRISLAIAVATASDSTVPSMVFDEVDVGIGGAVAEVVGRLLRELAARTQILCVTHLPQVAAQAQQQLKVSKQGDRKSVSTALDTLDQEGRVVELARMLGGVKVTEQTLAHAREMLGAAEG